PFYALKKLEAVHPSANAAGNYRHKQANAHPKAIGWRRCAGALRLSFHTRACSICASTTFTRPAPTRLNRTRERGRRVAPQSDVRELSWTELDRKAVDTIRVLAADAVEKVGSG